ncbi:MAG: amino acid dehydrogenase [Mesorhizobium amorphae]|nr:MAG: amino acid dehydrogenase [Mesorhizobium amorphae]
MTPTQDPAAAPDTIVIGAGIIGIACAAELAEAGRSVLVLDRTGICEETSSGNAAALAFPDYLPLAHKGMLRKLPGWLADPLGPLSIPPAYLPQLAPWLWRFLRAGHPRFFDAGVSAQSALMGLAESEWTALAERAGMSGMIRHDGALDLYEGEGEFRSTLPGWQVRERMGVSFEHVSGARLAELQPGLSPRFTHGTFMPGWKTVSDPKDFGKALWAYAEGRGARFRQARVTAITPGAPWRVETDTGSLSAPNLVLAAGAWSHQLARQLGDRVPLETERGYNTTLPAGAWPLRRQLTFVGHGFVVTPLANGLRVGGAVELGGLSRAPNFARSRAMLAKAQAFLPGLKTEGGREWMGFRPSLPDSLPVIGRARAPNLIYAFGHGHLGLTQAAATGHLVRQLVLGQTPALDLAPFSPYRF